MKTEQIITFIDGLILDTENRKEKKVYSTFSNILKSFERLDLSSEQFLLIEKKIEDLDLFSSQDKKLKYLKKQLEEFKNFLKEELLLVEEGYYIGMGIPLGMAFGIAMSTISGFDFGMGSDTTGGLITGMIVGMLIGSVMDEKAKKEKRVFKVT